MVNQGPSSTSKGSGNPGEGEQEEKPGPFSAPLDPKERIGAAVAGIIFGGAGGASVFLSENQAGSAALLLIAAVFLLMGIQGTAVRKAGKDSFDFAQKPAAQIVARSAELSEDDRPSEALAYIEGAVAASPQLGESTLVQESAGLAYERAVIAELQRIVPDMSAQVMAPRGGNHRVDATVVRGGRTATVEVKYRQAGYIGASQLRILIQRNAMTNGLLVANCRISQAAEAYLESLGPDTKIVVVEWRSPEDTPLLQRALDDLLG